MTKHQVKVIVNFHVSVQYSGGSCGVFSRTEKLWTDEDGMVTEDVVKHWEDSVKMSTFKNDDNVFSCNVQCTSFFKLDYDSKQNKNVKG